MPPGVPDGNPAQPAESKEGSTSQNGATETKGTAGKAAADGPVNMVSFMMRQQVMYLLMAHVCIKGKTLSLSLHASDPPHFFILKYN